VRGSDRSTIRTVYLYFCPFYFLAQ
jgi:hypothetical protein